MQDMGKIVNGMTPEQLSAIRGNMEPKEWDQLMTSARAWPESKFQGKTVKEWAQSGNQRAKDTLATLQKLENAGAPQAQATQGPAAAPAGPTDAQVRQNLPSDAPGSASRIGAGPALMKDTDAADLAQLQTEAGAYFGIDPKQLSEQQVQEFGMRSMAARMLNKDIKDPALTPQVIQRSAVATVVGSVLGRDPTTLSDADLANSALELELAGKRGVALENIKPEDVEAYRKTIVRDALKDSVIQRRGWLEPGPRARMAEEAAKVLGKPANQINNEELVGWIKKNRLSDATADEMLKSIDQNTAEFQQAVNSLCVSHLTSDGLNVAHQTELARDARFRSNIQGAGLVVGEGAIAPAFNAAGHVAKNLLYNTAVKVGVRAGVPVAVCSGVTRAALTASGSMAGGLATFFGGNVIFDLLERNGMMFNKLDPLEGGEFSARLWDSYNRAEELAREAEDPNRSGWERFSAGTRSLGNRLAGGVDVLTHPVTTAEAIGDWKAKERQNTENQQAHHEHYKGFYQNNVNSISDTLRRGKEIDWDKHYEVLDRITKQTGASSKDLEHITPEITNSYKPLTPQRKAYYEEELRKNQAKVKEHSEGSEENKKPHAFHSPIMGWSDVTNGTWFVPTPFGRIGPGR